MRFTPEVDIPEPLIKALSEEKLVVFVGAGVSARAFPNQKKLTYYPTFKELVYEIARRRGNDLSSNEQQSIDQGFSDRVLGEWHDRRHDIHATASSILQENEDGQRIDLHNAIIKLFPSKSKPRVVTTNFDDLLIRALRVEGLQDEPTWRVWEAPALPPAARFTGICFLHGRVKQPEEMILTDKDIGKAYMDEGWALKFAHSLFKEFNVLFIGYSLEDPPLRYLSLALAGTEEVRHWAFVPEPAEPPKRQNLERDWERRGVSPVWYPARRNNHRALERCILAWAEDNRRGFIESRNLLYNWGLSDPESLAPHELDRTKYFLSKYPQLLRDLAETVLLEKWFDQLLNWGHLNFLLRSKGRSQKAEEWDFKLGEALSRWLVTKPTECMIKLTPFRNSLNPMIIDIFFEYVEKTTAVNIEISQLRVIIEFFKVAIEQNKQYWNLRYIHKILSKLIETGFFEDAIWLFIANIQTNIRVEVTPNFQFFYARSTGKETTEIMPERINFDYPEDDMRDYLAKGCIDNIFKPHVMRIGYLLLTAMTYKFYEARLSIKRGGRGDFSHIRRQDIEAGVDDLTQGLENFFIDSLRDLWEELLTQNTEQALKILEMWREIDDIIFQRLSIHAIRRLVEKGHVG